MCGTFYWGLNCPKTKSISRIYILYWWRSSKIIICHFPKYCLILTLQRNWPNTPNFNLNCVHSFEIWVKIRRYSENSQISIFEYLHQYWIYPWSDFSKKCPRSVLRPKETFQNPETCLGWDMKISEVSTLILAIFEIVIFHHIAEISTMAEISGLHIFRKKSYTPLFHFAKKIIWIGCIQKIWQASRNVSCFFPSQYMVFFLTVVSKAEEAFFKVRLEV